MLIDFEHLFFFFGVCLVICVADTLSFLQIAFSFIVYPSLILAYMGQAAYLSKHHSLQSDYRIGFYVSVPGKRAYYHLNLFKGVSILKFPSEIVYRFW